MWQGKLFSSPLKSVKGTDLLFHVGDLKKQCETNIGVVSQCCLTKHVFKMSKQYLANVALKINVKVYDHFSLSFICEWIFIHCKSRSMFLTHAVCMIWVLLCLAVFNQVGGRNTVLVDALSRRIPLVSDIPTIIFGADVTHPHPGEDTSPSIAAVSSPMSIHNWVVPPQLLESVIDIVLSCSSMQHKHDMSFDVWS
jgi:hypothetical protein